MMDNFEDTILDFGLSDPHNLSVCDTFTSADAKYYNCSLPDGANGCEYLKHMHEAKAFRRYFLDLLPLIFSIVAFVVNLIFGIIIATDLHVNRHSKKRCCFLINRTVSTLVAIIMFWIVLVAWKTEHFMYTSAAIFMLVGSLSFFAFAGTYLALSSMLYFAVVHPYAYREHVTIRRCLYVISLIWLFSVSISIIVGLLGGTLFYPETAPINCPFNSCQRPFATVLTIIIAIIYTSVLAAYIIMFSKMHLKNLTALSSESVNRNKVAMNRLSFNLILFSICNLPILVVCIIALCNLNTLKNLGNGRKSPCKTFENGKLFFEAEILASIGALIWLTGMTVDPLINTFGDPGIKDFISTRYNSVRSYITQSLIKKKKLNDF